MAKEIEIVVDEDTAEVTITTTGFGGKSCQDETKEIEEEMGIRVKDVKTAEFYKPVKQETRNTNKA